jgi:aldehyde dehydrogenase
MMVVEAHGPSLPCEVEFELRRVSRLRSGTTESKEVEMTVTEETAALGKAPDGIYIAPGRPGSLVDVRDSYGNFIGGKWVAPVKDRYMHNVSPVTGHVFTDVAESTSEDVELALDAAHAAKDAWGETSLPERAVVLNAIADVVEANLTQLAVAESWENGKPVRETLAADIPLAVDHFRYFAGATRSLEGRTTEIDKDTVAYHFHEPLGVVAQIIPFNFPLLMAAWKIAPALAAGNCTVIKPASPTPWSILKLAEVIADVVPPGVISVVTGPGAEIGKALASSPRIAKVGFTGETITGRLIMQYAAQNLIPSTVELGGKSPNIFFADVMAEDDEFLDKAVEGLVLYAFNKGEVCTCPSRALIHESIYDEFMARCLDRIGKIIQGNPLDPNTMIGAQNSAQQLEKILRYIEIGKKEGAEVLIGGHRNVLKGDLRDGYYVQPTVLKGDNKMRVFQEEIFGPVLSVTTFNDEADAVRIANDTLYGLGAGVWTRNGNVAYRMGRAIKAGRVWTNCYHLYPAGAAFGGYKISGVGRENHQMMLEHYSQTKNLLVSYSTKPLGFF